MTVNYDKLHMHMHMHMHMQMHMHIHIHTHMHMHMHMHMMHGKVYSKWPERFPGFLREASIIGRIKRERERETCCANVKRMVRHIVWTHAAP